MKSELELSILNVRRFAADPHYWLDTEQGRRIIAGHIRTVLDELLALLECRTCGCRIEPLTTNPGWTHAVWCICDPRDHEVTP